MEYYNNDKSNNDSDFRQLRKEFYTEKGAEAEKEMAETIVGSAAELPSQEEPPRVGPKQEERGCLRCCETGLAL